MRVTHSGVVLRNLEYADIVRMPLGDIAHALEGCIRWGGHTNPRFTTAQHSVAIARHIIETTGNLWLALAGVWHDASDALLPDVPTLLKRTSEFAFFRRLEKDVLRSMVSTHAPAVERLLPATKPYDWAALGTEYETGFPPTAAVLQYRDWHCQQWPDFGTRIPLRHYDYSAGDWLALHRALKFQLAT